MVELHHDCFPEPHLGQVGTRKAGEGPLEQTRSCSPASTGHGSVPFCAVAFPFSRDTPPGSRLSPFRPLPQPDLLHA